MSARQPVSVQVPGPGDDRPSWVKVGAIAAAGFLIGVAWPRLAGVRLGPSAPGEASAAGAPAPVAAPPKVDPIAPRAPEAPASAALAGEAVPHPETMASATPLSTVTLLKTAVTACRTAEGEVLKGTGACGTVPAFDALAVPKLRQLARCPTAEGAAGRLTLTFTVDFASNKLTSSVARGSTVENPDAWLMCVQGGFKGTSLAGIEHNHARYIIAYTVGFAPTRERAARGAKAPAAALASHGEAPAATEGPTLQLVEPSVVRDAPRTGQVVARLPRGAQVKVGRMQESWFRVHYGPGFASEGWVYRGSIGR